jgi:hypothetical protein
MKVYRIYLINGIVIEFTGNHLPERHKESPNWHYYKTNRGITYHFRKEHIVAVEEYE